MGKEWLKNHTDLEVYQMAFDAAMHIFELSKKFPVEEKYSLTDQIRRASRSVCANLAEACQVTWLVLLNPLQSLKFFLIYLPLAGDGGRDAMPPRPYENTGGDDRWIICAKHYLKKELKVELNS